MRTRSLLPAVLLLLLGALLVSVPVPMAAQTYPLELELGYRFLNVNGNMDEYRSQINEREGFLIRHITWATADTGDDLRGFVDHFRFDGSELGIGPAGALRMEAGRTGLYNLRFFYRRAEAFSSLVDWANPLFPAVIPGQHTFSRVRNVYDAELELLPGHVITPLLGYIRNEYSGPGRTTYHIGQDEFQLNENLSNRDEEFRLGASFNAGPVSGRFLQGWRRFRETDSFGLTPGAGNGNNNFPVLGVNITASSINRTTETKTDTPSTLALVTGRIGPLKLIGSYQRAHGETDATAGEAATGSFVSFFEISRFFNGFAESASTKSEATFWKGMGRAELALGDGIDLSAEYSRRHRYMDGFALVNTLFQDTRTFTATDPPDIRLLLNANNSMDRFDSVFDASVNVRSLGPFALRAGWTRDDSDLTVSPDLSEIVISGNQGGSFNRRIDTYRGGASFSVAGFTLAADYIGDRANQAVMRTDYLDRDQFRFRLSWSTESFLRIAFNGRKTTASNDDPGIDYTSKVWEYGGELELILAKPVTLHFSASKYLAHTAIPIRVPQDFSTAVSDHREDGVSLEGGATVTIGKIRLDGSYSKFTNNGSYPFYLDRLRTSADIPITTKMAFIAEWLRDRYNDTATFNLGRYDADRYGFYLRLSPFAP